MMPATTLTRRRVATLPRPARLPAPVRLRRSSYLGSNAEPVRVDSLLIRADAELTASVSEAMNLGSGFIRGSNGDPFYLRPDGERITDPARMRIDCLGFTEHVERAYQITRRSPLAAVTYGDLLTNEEYVLALFSGAGARLFCRDSELARMDAGHVYHALGVDRDGGPWAGRVRFTPDPENAQVVDEGGEALGERLRLLFTGPPVVWDGRIMDPARSAACWKADLRHVFTMPACRLPGGGQALLGAAELMQDADRLAAAARGDAVRVALPPGDLASLLCDLEARGYEVVASPAGVLRRGQAAVEGGQAVIRYLPGLYPHGLLGIRATQDAWIHMQVGGLSTKAGCTVTEAGELMEAAGARYAIGLDQGADPQRLARLDAREADLSFRPSFNYRARVSAALVWVEA